MKHTISNDNQSKFNFQKHKRNYVDGVKITIFVMLILVAGRPIPKLLKEKKHKHVIAYTINPVLSNT